MRLTSAHVRNYRLLQDAEVAIDPNTTLIVGRNNSGKTSLVDLFCKFVGGRSLNFTADDFSADCAQQFLLAIGSYARSVECRANGALPDAEKHLASALELLPSISLTLDVEYQETDDLASLSEVILDLDPDRTDARIVARFAASRPASFLQVLLDAEIGDSAALYKELSRLLGDQFGISYEAIDAVGGVVRKSISRATVDRIFAVDFIYAQNQLDDSSGDDTRNLSRTFESFYRSTSDDDATVADIETALEETSKRLDKNFADLFKPVFDDMAAFGVEAVTPVQRLQIVSVLEAAKLLQGSTRLFYQDGVDGPRLPEGANGLGYTKLIYIILELVGFYERCMRSSPVPAFHVLFIEEPEAHLHPQMQDVFMKNIWDFVATKAGWNVQVVVTTHSSHIVTGRSFDGTRYFDNSVKPLKVRDLSKFEHAVAAEPAETVRFLKQYMTLHRCDMFFADKVVLIEGTVERLLLPKMIDQAAPTLKHNYVSVIEVGGAYAYRFKELLAFINVQTLIITDIDSVEGRKACPPSTPDCVSSNYTLKSWLPAGTSIENLLKKTESEKTSGRVRVAYQIPEVGLEWPGRSFEESFILANAESLSGAKNFATAAAFQDDAGASLTAEKIQQDSYVLAAKIDKKTDFAFDILSLPTWVTPLYIKEGLEWLAKTPSE